MFFLTFGWYSVSFENEATIKLKMVHFKVTPSAGAELFPPFLSYFMWHLKWNIYTHVLWDNLLACLPRPLRVHHLCLLAVKLHTSSVPVELFFHRHFCMICFIRHTVPSTYTPSPLMISKATDFVCFMINSYFCKTSTYILTFSSISLVLSCHFRAVSGKVNCYNCDQPQLNN